MNEAELRQALFIKELENIKAEIQDLDLGFVDEEFKSGVAYGIMKFNQILNKHILELKGEDKQSRCNSCQNNTDELSGECYECVNCRYNTKIKGIEDWYEPISKLKGE